MIKECVTKLVDELPESIIQKLKKNKNHNLILEGGVFNGSYLIGALYFLKELEKRKYIKMQKFSGCSIGAICALLYLIDELNLAEELYAESLEKFKEYYNLQFINNLLEKILTKMPNNTYQKMKNKLYICYYDIEINKKIVETNFNDNTHLIECIRRSSFVPFLMNGEILHQNQYVDGIFPHIFSLEERNVIQKNGRSNSKSKTLYLDLVGSDKVKYLISVKNEYSNFHRIMAGILDIHLFFMKESKTQMCSYVEDWKVIDQINNRIIKYCIERIIITTICILHLLKTFFSKEEYSGIYNHKIFHSTREKIIKIYKQWLDSYCF
jgi:hypothetical protein